jgi:hypothetical protein
MDIVLKGKSRLLLSVITAADLGHGDAIAPSGLDLELLDRALTDAPEPRSIAPACTRRPASPPLAVARLVRWRGQKRKFVFVDLVSSDHIKMA